MGGQTGRQGAPPPLPPRRSKEDEKRTSDFSLVCPHLGTIAKFFMPLPGDREAEFFLVTLSLRSKSCPHPPASHIQQCDIP